MLKFSHRNLIVFSGLVWLAIGGWLMPLGLNFLVTAAKNTEPATARPWLNAMAPYFGGLEMAAIALVVMALFVGYFKGIKVLGKSANRGIARIQSLPNPAPLAQVYAPFYYVLILFMIGLGISMKWFGLPLDIRGFVDTAVGAALINGAMVYFRRASTLGTQPAN